MRNVLIIGVVALFCASFTRPDDVLVNSDIARQRMWRLMTALAIYQNEHDRAGPDDLADLYPLYISDPLDFWHPGDSDPPPTTINNSILNAQNSARISFEWDTLGPAGPMDRVMIRDNSASNNAGLFVNLLTADGVMETDPPLATPRPTSTALSLAHLRVLQTACRIYSNENSEAFPPSLRRLWVLGEIRSPRTFWNPGDSDPLPSDITNSEPNGLNSDQVSFEYLVGGAFEWELMPSTAVIRDNTPANNGGFGVNVAWGDGRVEFVPIPSIGDGNGDGKLDTDDWSRMAECLTGPVDLVQVQTCRIFDWNGDFAVDLRDMARFVQTFAQPVEPVWMGDGNGDCHVDLVDWTAMYECWTGPIRLVYTDSCRIFDSNGDSKVNLRDFAAFANAFTGPNQTIPGCQP